MNKIIMIIISIILLTNVNASYINTDKIIVKTNTNIALKSKIDKNTKIIKIITKHKANLTDTKHKILNDLIVNCKYQDIIKKNSITIDHTALENFYKEISIKIYNTQTKNLKKVIETQYKINEKDISNFITNNITIKKLYKTILSEGLLLSNNDIKNFFETSNYERLKRPLYEFKVLQISFKRTNKNSLKKIKNLIKTLDKDFTEESIIKNQHLSGTHFKIINIKPQNKEHWPIKEFIENEKQRNIIGPINIQNNVYLFKILEKKDNTEYYKPHIKICYYTIQKKKINVNSKTIKVIKKPIVQENKKIKKILRKSKNYYWVYKDNVENGLYNKIKNLRKNELSDIIETKTGWYIIKVIDKAFDQKSNIYNYIEKNVTLEKILKSKKDAENKITTNSTIIYYK